MAFLTASCEDSFVQLHFRTNCSDISWGGILVNYFMIKQRALASSMVTRADLNTQFVSAVRPIMCCERKGRVASVA